MGGRVVADAYTRQRFLIREADVALPTIEAFLDTCPDAEVDALASTIAVLARRLSDGHQRVKQLDAEIAQLKADMERLEQEDSRRAWMRGEAWR